MHAHNGQDPCENKWYGVMCTPPGDGKARNDGADHVYELQLAENNLDGYAPCLVSLFESLDAEMAGLCSIGGSIE